HQPEREVRDLQRNADGWRAGRCLGRRKDGDPQGGQASEIRAEARADLLLREHGARARTGDAVRDRARGVSRGERRTGADRDRAGSRCRARRNREDGLPAPRFPRTEADGREDLPASPDGIVGGHSRQAARVPLAAGRQVAPKPRHGPREGTAMTAIRIDGATRLYAIIGHPIVQVRSPETYSELFAGAGLNAVLVPLHVLPEGFDATI